MPASTCCSSCPRRRRSTVSNPWRVLLLSTTSRGCHGAPARSPRRWVRAVFAGVAVDLPLDVFLQASAQADTVLGALVLDAVGTPRRVADLYSGVGTFTFALASRAPVHAVEGDAEAA